LLRLVRQWWAEHVTSVEIGHPVIATAEPIVNTAASSR